MTPMTLSSRRRLVCLMFFFSGACGLIYEIVWTRMMSLVFGVTVYAITSVLCSFMLGLALGSLFFGRTAEKVRRPLVAYGWLEIGVAVLALAFPALLEAIKPIFITIQHHTYENHLLFSIVRFFLILPLMLAPTFLMGGTLPLVTRYFSRSRGSLASDLAFLYATNTAGAMIGTVAVGFVMLEYLGVHHSIQLAALLNVAIGVGAIVLGRAMPAAEAPEAEPEAAAPIATAEDGFSRIELTPALRRLVYLAIGISGFASLGMQIIWNRVLVFHTNNSTYAFTSILVMFLLGLSLGSYLFSWMARRITQPVRMFALLEVGIGIFALATFLLNALLLRANDNLLRLIPFDNWFQAILMMNIQSAVMFFIPTVFMGMTLPLATRIVTRDLKEASRRVGAVYAANTIGSVLGSFIVGFMMIPLFGLRNSVLLLTTANFLVAAGLFLQARTVLPSRRRMAAVASVVLCILAHLLIPRDVLVRFYTNVIGTMHFFKEEATDTIMVIDAKDQTGKPNPHWRWVVFTDMRGTAGHPTRQDNRFTAHLPMLLHPSPKNVLTICVGASNSVGAFTRHKRMETLDAVELSKGIVEASKYFNTNYQVWKEPRDPRLSLHIDDGRSFLLGTQRRFDVIHLEPPLLYTNGVVFLYTREFYELCRQRLKPGGLAVQWVNVGTSSAYDIRVALRAFMDVFPNGVVWQTPDLSNILFIGGADPLRIDVGNMVKVLRDEPTLLGNLHEDNLENLPQLLTLFTYNPDDARKFIGDAPVMTDDRTIIDFTNPKSIYSGHGFTQIISNNSWDVFYTWNEDLWKQYLDGGWALCSRFSTTSSDVRPMIDWSGISPEVRPRLDQRIGELEELKRNAMAGFSEGNLRFRSIINTGSLVNPLPASFAYLLKPNLKNTYEGVEIVTNADGLRDGPVGDKKPGTRRVAAVGDEITFGFGLPVDKTWPKLLQATPAGAADAALDVINMGQPGFSGVQKIELALERALPLKPDVLALQVHGHDARLAPFAFNSSFMPLRSFYTNYEPLDFMTMSLAEPDSLRTGAVRIPGFSPDPGPYEVRPEWAALAGWPNLEQAWRKLAQSCAAQGTRLVMLVPPAPNAALDGEGAELLGRLRALAGSLQITVVEPTGPAAADAAALRRSAEDPTPTLAAQTLLAAAMHAAVATPAIAPAVPPPAPVAAPAVAPAPVAP